MKDRTNEPAIMFTIIILLVIGFLFLSSDGRCILKGGQPIDSYAGIQECYSKEECSDYKSRICIDEDGDIIP